MCGIWDWQSTIVKDLNDSQDPKHSYIAGYLGVIELQLKITPIFLAIYSQ